MRGLSNNYLANRILEKAKKKPCGTRKTTLNLAASCSFPNIAMNSHVYIYIYIVKLYIYIYKNQVRTWTLKNIKKGKPMERPFETSLQTPKPPLLRKKTPRFVRTSVQRSSSSAESKRSSSRSRPRESRRVTRVMAKWPCMAMYGHITLRRVQKEFITVDR